MTNFNNNYNHLFHVNLKIDPGIYRVVSAESLNQNVPNISNSAKYRLEYETKKFTVPDKTYGDLTTNAVRIWNDYALGGKSTGCMLLGDKGTGKTLLGTLISNIAIDNGVPVILVTEIKATIELLQFLTRLSNCVLLLDEFSKNMTFEVQNQMLTMFSDVFNTRKLIIITENSDRCINSYILDRPGRVKYRLDFNKLSIKTFEDYTNNFVKNKTFLEDLKNVYKSATEFSFDQLSTIVEEHLNYPDEKLDNLLAVLNVKSIRKKPRLVITKIIDTKKPDREVKFNHFGNMNFENFKSNPFGIKFEIMSDKDENITTAQFNVIYQDLKQSDINCFIAKKDIFEIQLQKTY